MGRPDCTPDLHYTDPRLAELYDLENPLGPDAAFYLRLAQQLDPAVIIDVGCGTGLITVELASTGRQVTGVDPAQAMLEIARKRQGTERVHWILGDSRDLGCANADLAIMTGNVAQVFVDDELWATTLRELHGALRPGGCLSFESRNPLDRGWERWTPESTRTRLVSSSGPVETWLKVARVDQKAVLLEGHNFFAQTREDIVSLSELRFRTRQEIEKSLRGAGFNIENVFGGWNCEPFEQSSRIMIFVAKKE